MQPVKKTGEVQLSNFAQLYQLINQAQPHALLLQELQALFFDKVQFDPTSNEPLSISLSHLALKANNLSVDTAEKEDKLSQLLDYCSQALKNIIYQPRNRIVREHELVPIYKAQKLDSRSVQWLSRQPGNNIRQKLSANPNVLALNRRESLDTAENRLVHHMIQTLDYLLNEKKENCGLNENQQWLAQEIDHWNHIPEVQEIKSWQAVPPNNVLLEDKNYKKIRVTYLQLQNIDNEISTISLNSANSVLHQLFVSMISHLQAISGIHLLEKTLEPVPATLIYRQYPSNSTGELTVEGYFQNASNHKHSLQLTTENQHNKLIIKLSSASSQSGQQFVIQCLSDQVLLSGSDMKEVNYSLHQDTVDKTNHHKPEIVQISQKIVHELLGTSKGERYFKPIVVNEFATINIDCSMPTLRMDSNANQHLDNAQQKIPLPLKLLAQQGEYFQDLSLATAINLSEDSELICWRSLSNEMHANKIADLIGLALKVPKLCYLVSDHISDFESRTLRQQLNRVFYRATPLPKSIAAAYSLEQRQYNFTNNQLLIVLENTPDGVFATPVVRKKQKQVFYWERHPSVKITDETFSAYETLKDEFPNPVIEALNDCFSHTELYKRRNLPAVHYKSQWFTLQKHHQQAIEKQHIQVAAQSIINAIKENSELNCNQPLFVTANDHLELLTFSKGKQATDHITNLDITRGAIYLYGLGKAQKEEERKSGKGQHVFWRDHLPKLYTRLPKAGRETEFEFVGDKTTIEPKRGKRVAIEIPASFDIPAGQQSITLPIFQGKGKNQKRFMLNIDHQSLPLAESQKCTLDLGYTYGDEEPYQLLFKPISDDAPFRQIVAKWSQWTLNDLQKNIHPSYPTRKSINELRKLSSQGRKETDILDWAERVCAEINEYFLFYEQDSRSKRITVQIDPNNYFQDRKNNYCMKVFINNVETFIHQSQFEPGLFESYPSIISGDLENSKSKQGGLRLANITEPLKLPEERLKRLASKWRFPILTLFDQERSFNDADFPEPLENTVNVVLQQASNLISNPNVSSRLKQELEQFISYFHAAAPEDHAKSWITASSSKEGIRTSHMQLAYCIGDCSQTWQQEILNNLLNPVDDTGGTRAVSLEILGTAVWRSEKLIYTLSSAQVTQLVTRICQFMHDEASRMAANSSYFKWNSLLRRLELVLALVRLRNSDNPDIKKLMETGGDCSEKLLSAIRLLSDKIGKMLHSAMEKERKIKCRVHMDNIEKPESYANTPDILYALNMYLSGDDGANRIVISEIVSE